MEKNNNFELVGHLQVMDEPLSSLYADKVSGNMYIFVRIFEDMDNASFVLSEVSPSIVVDYMDGKVGLKSIFSNHKAYYYVYQNKQLSLSDFRPLTNEDATSRLSMDGLDDMYDRTLSYRSVPLKQYLRHIV